MQRNWKRIVGIALIVVALAGMIGWETFGRDRLMTEKVLVCSRDVEKNEVITKDMLGMLKIDKRSVIVGRVKEPEKIIGRRAANFIPKGLQLSPEFFVEADLALSKNQKICAIPKEWIFAYPQTIRRGDTVSFYAVNQDQEGLLPPAGSSSIMNAKVAFVKDTANREVIDVTPDRIDASADAAAIEIIIDDERYAILKNMAESGYLFILMYS